jgi:hypothetical protein
LLSDQDFQRHHELVRRRRKGTRKERADRELLSRSDRRGGYRQKSLFAGQWRRPYGVLHAESGTKTGAISAQSLYALGASNATSTRLGGRVTLLDLGDEARRFAPLLADYGLCLKTAAIGTWRARMVNEYSSARVFDALAEQLAGASFSPELADTCHGFAEEERKHGVLCGAVVLALGGDATACSQSTRTRRRAPRRCATSFTFAA